MAGDGLDDTWHVSWVVKVGVAIVVVVLGVVAWSAFRPFTYHINDAPWDAGVVAADGRSLTVTFTGVAARGQPADLCWQGYEGVAVDAGDHVEVTVQRFQSATIRHALQNTTCTAPGFPRTVRVDLPTPLAGRRVVDPSLGRDRPVVDGAQLAGLQDQPGGATLTAETAKPLTRGGAMSVRTYTLANGTSVDLTQSADRLPPADRNAASTNVEVHGQPAQYLDADRTAYVEWQEHDQWLRLSTTSAPLPQDQLREIAERSHVP